MKTLLLAALTLFSTSSYGQNDTVHLSSAFISYMEVPPMNYFWVLTKIGSDTLFVGNLDGDNSVVDEEGLMIYTYSDVIEIEYQVNGDEITIFLIEEYDPYAEEEEPESQREDVIDTLIYRGSEYYGGSCMDNFETLTGEEVTWWNVHFGTYHKEDEYDCGTMEEFINQTFIITHYTGIIELHTEEGNEEIKDEIVTEMRLMD